MAASPESADAFCRQHPQIGEWLSSLRTNSPRGGLLVSHHSDAVVEVTRGYGDGRERPEDYLSRFDQWIRDNRNRHAALTLVLTAPASLTRKALKELMLAMDDEGFTEFQLRPAWREVKHEDCAARLIGYIRSQALGSPLIPFDERVDRAAARLRAQSTFQWTQNQRRWLDRIVSQVKAHALVDRDSFKAGAFASAGGYATINKSFSGKLDQLLESLHTEIWRDDVA